MKRIVIGNWKCNPGSVQESVALAEAIEGILFRITNPPEVAIAPPFLFLDAVRESVHDVVLGAQDAFWAPLGAYTGEISFRQLKNLGVRYVLVGHSERRAHLGETNELIRQKVLAVAKAGMRPVLCVGEKKREGKNLRAPRAFVKKQLTECLLDIPAPLRAKLVVAYEPVWAIGGTKADTPADAAEMILYIKEELGKLGFPAVPVLYGGSVHGQNAKGLFKEQVIDGVLVGGASLKLKDFRMIMEAATEVPAEGPKTS